MITYASLRGFVLVNLILTACTLNVCVTFRGDRVWRFQNWIQRTGMQDMSMLKCWKCISHDCEGEPEDNYKASRVTCDEGRECMKVHYRMYDNITHYDSVIRTCTAGLCQATFVKEYQKCLATPKLYMISGCVLRSCCSDRDMCNTGYQNHGIQKYIAFLILNNVIIYM